MIFYGQIISAPIIYIIPKIPIKVPYKKNGYFNRRFRRGYEIISYIDFNLDF